MILLDTNVVSEPLSRAPDTRVVSWIDAQAAETLFLSTITVAELRFGVASLPQGKRRDFLSESLETEILPLFANRVLGFDLPATKAYAELMSRARRAGTAIGVSDGYIAAIAVANAMAVATRDASPFRAAGLTVVDPWDQPED